MNTNQFNKPSVALRVGCLIAAVTVTAATVSSQLGIAKVYTVQAEALQAAQRNQAVAQQTAVPVARNPKS